MKTLPAAPEAGVWEQQRDELTDRSDSGPLFLSRPCTSPLGLLSLLCFSSITRSLGEMSKEHGRKSLKWNYLRVEAIGKI